MNDAILAAIREVSAIPAERRLWSLATIAEYSELSVSHVAQVIAARPDFPKPVRPCGTGKPRWVAGEVVRWFESWR